MGFPLSPHSALLSIRPEGSILSNGGTCCYLHISDYVSRLGLECIRRDTLSSDGCTCHTGLPVAEVSMKTKEEEL